MNRVYVLLDRTYSMKTNGLWDEALGSVNGYVRNLPRETRVVIGTFDTVGYDIVRDAVAGECRELTNEDAVPRGSTNLWDAATRMMQRMLEDGGERSVLVVMTDGEENSSQHYTKNHVREHLRTVEGKGWQVVFLGANFDKVGDEAKKVGLTFDRTVNMSKGNMRGFASDNLATATSFYLEANTAMCFSAADRVAAGEKNAK